MAPMDDFVRQMQSELITIEVGRGETLKKYKVPKEFLCERSAWFDRALKSGRFKEGTTNTVALPDDSVTAFDAFFTFIYQYELRFADAKDDPALRNQQILDCVEIWMFGDKYIEPELQKMAMQALCTLFEPEKNGLAIEPATLTKCFKALERSPLQVLVAEYVVDRVVHLGSAFQIDAELGTAEGFLLAMHNAEGVYRNVESFKFPRCKRPRKYKNIFAPRIAAVENHKMSDGTYCTYATGWADEGDDYRCSSCGYWVASRARAKCINCLRMGSLCSCNYTDIRPVCADCWPRSKV